LWPRLGWVGFFPVAAAITGVGGVFYILMWDRIERLVSNRERLELDLEAG